MPSLEVRRCRLTPGDYRRASWRRQTGHKPDALYTSRSTRFTVKLATVS